MPQPKNINYSFEMLKLPGTFKKKRLGWAGPTEALFVFWGEGLVV